MYECPQRTVCYGVSDIVAVPWKEIVKQITKHVSLPFFLTIGYDFYAFRLCLDFIPQKLSIRDVASIHEALPTATFEAFARRLMDAWEPLTAEGYYGFSDVFCVAKVFEERQETAI